MPGSRYRPLLALLAIIALVAGILAAVALWAYLGRPRGPAGVSGAVAQLAPALPTRAEADADLHFRPRHRSRQLHELDGTWFRIGYDEERRDPAWVAYELDGPVRYPGREPSRPIFATDPRTDARVTQHDYTGSGFDRGHLCPAFAMWSRHGSDGFLATFIMSNVIPQPHAVNAGVWEDLETAIAARGGWAERFGPLVVVDGPVFSNDPPRLRTGPAIPTACFMVVVAMHQGRALAWIIPDRADVRGPAERFLVPIRQVEQVTGLDLFAGTGTQLRTALEDAPPDPAAWR